MRISVYIPPELVERLNNLASCEYRNPRQQIEFLLHQFLQNLSPNSPGVVSIHAIAPEGEPHAQR